MSIKIITEKTDKKELEKAAQNTFGDFVKAVVDIEKRVIAFEAEMHADLEAALLDDGSDQKSLWGINIYPAETRDDMIEFDSMINIRPAQGNRSRGVEDEDIREKIISIVGSLVE